MEENTVENLENLISDPDQNKSPVTNAENISEDIESVTKRIMLTIASGIEVHFGESIFSSSEDITAYVRYAFCLPDNRIITLDDVKPTSTTFVNALSYCTYADKLINMTNQSMQCKVNFAEYVVSARKFNILTDGAKIKVDPPFYLWKIEDCRLLKTYVTADSEPLEYVQDYDSCSASRDALEVIEERDNKMAAIVRREKENLMTAFDAARSNFESEVFMPKANITVSEALDDLIRNLVEIKVIHERLQIIKSFKA